ncbi:MAG: PQQ-binding-like beta-propeller repeat protein, partial [Acidobacteriota bacterium]
PSFRGMNILTPTVWNDSVLTSTYRNSSFLYRIGEGEAGGFEVEQGWTNEAQAYMSSPVVVADTAYMHLGNGRLTAMSLATGERHWTSKPFGKYWSMVRQGERILALDSGGELILIEASPDELKVLDQREISSSETWAYLAVAGDQVVIRELNGLTVWRFGDSSAGRSDSPSAVSAASFGSWP